MTFYRERIVPFLLDRCMRAEVARVERERFVPLAAGRVIEIGVGSGLNFPFYTRRVGELIGVDPSTALLALARRRTGGAPCPARLFAAAAEAIPAPDASVDTVLSTWTLCSVSDPAAALREARRVLKADGRFVFVEHGRAPDESVRRWQDRLNRPWRCVSGGCNMNRPIADLIEAAGFRFEQIDRGYVEGPRLLAYFYKGTALRA